MTRRTRIGIVSAITLVIPVWAAFSFNSAVADPPTASDDCPSASAIADGVVDEDQVADGMDATGCDLVGLKVEVGESGATVSIPPPGEGIDMDGFAVDPADSFDLFVGVSPTGELAFESGGDGGGAGGTPSACNDEANNQLSSGTLLGNTTFNIKTSTFPGYIDQSSTRDAIESGIRAWPQQFNDCGMPDQIELTVSDGGGTDHGSAVNTDGCGSGSDNDSVSVFSFGTIPFGLVALTCRHVVFEPTRVYSNGGDVKFSTDVTWTNFPTSPSCTNQVDLQSIATHESGHWFGAAHVDPSAHPELTMRNGGIGSVTCKTKLRTLGKGDVLSMRHLY